MKDPREIIIRPVITEHSYDQMEKNTYTFEVAKDANKIEIRQAIEAIFDVTVVKEVQAQARALPAGQDPHVEEGDGHPQGRRHDRAVRQLGCLRRRRECLKGPGRFSVRGPFCVME